MPFSVALFLFLCVLAWNSLRVAFGRQRGRTTSLLKMASQVPTQLLGDISEVPRTGSDAAQMRSGIISSVRTSFFARNGASKANLSDSEKYLTFFLGA